MEIIILKLNFKEGLNILGKINIENINLPILRNFLIETVDSKIKLSATNLEIAITSFIPAKIIKEGELTLPLNITSLIINNLQNEKINLETKDNNLIIKTDNYTAKIQGIKKEEFPIIPKVENNKEFFEIESSLLKNSLLSITNAAQYLNLRPELNGVLFDFQYNLLKLAATDSFRLAEKTITEQNFKTNIDKKFKIIIPLKAVNELIRIISDKENEKINIFIDPSQILFKSEKFEFISRLVNGEFPDYQQIIPQSTSTEIIINKNELINALKLTSSFSDKLNEIKLIINEGAKNIEIYSSNPIIGENQYLVPAKIKGEPVEMVFNWKFLLDGIKTIEEENIFMGFNGNNKPALIKPNNNKDYFYILMPIKAN